MAKKFYGVRKGKKVGVFTSWEECKTCIHGYPGAIYKGFLTLKEAEDFVENKQERATIPIQVGLEEKVDKIAVYAFVDGSYNQATKVYGYGGFLSVDGKKYILQGSGTETEMAAMRNVAGEIGGCMAAVEKAIQLQLPRLAIYYDYMGIEMWAMGNWKRNKKGTIEYYEFMKKAMSQIELTFIKVKGHSGVEGNEEADVLAKKAVGIIL